MRRTKISLLLLILVLTAVSWISAPFPEEIVLHHLATFAGVAMTVGIDRRYKFSVFASACLAIFLGLHILGARYIYSYVPYDDWSRALLGVSPQEIFGFHRNHYDRLVHFAFGLLMVRPVLEIVRSATGLGRNHTMIAVLLIVIGVSFIYELVEWGVALTLAPSDAESFNGQQGDMWDAHKDMALALLGSVFGIIPLWRQARF